MNKKLRFNSATIHGGQKTDPVYGAVMPPRNETSTYSQTSPGIHKGFEYSRTHNPTRQALENSIASIENAKYGLAFCSGLAAIDAIIKLLKPGDEVISTNDLYGGSYRLFTKIFEDFGIKFHFVGMENFDLMSKHINNNTKLFWVETPTNPMMNVIDIKKISKLAKEYKILLAVDNTFALGSGTFQFSNVYALNFTGEASKATALRVGTDFRTASSAASNNTVAVRDATGNIAANLFQGTATQARYADLAENYATDEEYPVGTAIAVGGDEEVRSAGVGDICIGVISDNPAYLMNSEAEGQAVGLKGRVPVRVNGPISKGQAVYAWKDGVCSTITTNALVGVALETSTEEGEKLVECVLKV